MDFLEANITIMLQIARERSEGEDIDKYWISVLPERSGDNPNALALGPTPVVSFMR